jgi:hypothetical protein
MKTLASGPMGPSDGTGEVEVAVALMGSSWPGMAGHPYLPDGSAEAEFPVVTAVAAVATVVPMTATTVATAATVVAITSTDLPVASMGDFMMDFRFRGQGKFPMPALGSPHRHKH